MTTFKIAHLYGNLLNTYGDNGNMLMLKYYAKKLGYEVETTVVSLDQELIAEDYDLIFIGGGQDLEQAVVSKDIQNKKEELKNYVNNNGVLVAICGGYQLLGHYYIGANGNKIKGTSILDIHTETQINNRFIGDIEIYNEEFNETYKGFENHNGMTFLGEGIKPLGIVKAGNGNNGKDSKEGAQYKNVFCSYLHGPLLVRNQHLTERIVKIAIERKEAKLNK